MKETEEFLYYEVARFSLTVSLAINLILEVIWDFNLVFHLKSMDLGLAI
jgi:hypothetical protein